MVNLLPEEMREEKKEKRKQGKEPQEIEIIKPSEPGPSSEPSKPLEAPKSPEPSEPSKPFVPPSPPSEIPKPKISKPEPPKPETPKFRKAEEIFKAPEEPKFKEGAKEAKKTEEEWTLPKTKRGARGDLPEVSLSPEKIIILPRMVRSKIIILLIWIMVMLMVFAGIWWWTNDRLKRLSEETKSAQAEIKTVEEEIKPLVGVKKRIADIESKFSRAQNVLSNHVYWSKFFELLEIYTIPEVSFKGFSGNTSGSIHLNAQALDLPAVGRQIIVFQEAQDFVEKVNASNITVHSTGVTFSLDLSLKPNVFYLGE